MPNVSTDPAFTAIAAAEALDELAAPVAVPLEPEPEPKPEPELEAKAEPEPEDSVVADELAVVTVASTLVLVTLMVFVNVVLKDELGLEEVVAVVTVPVTEVDVNVAVAEAVILAEGLLAVEQVWPAFIAEQKACAAGRTCSEGGQHVWSLICV